MIKPIAALAVSLALAGCAAPRATDAAAREAWIWRCDGGVTFTSQITPDGVEVITGARTYRLPAVISRSGARYSDGRVEFWEHGGEAMLNGAAGGPYANCANREGDVVAAH